MKFLALMYEGGLIGESNLAKASERRLRAAQVDPDRQDPKVPPPLRKTTATTNSPDVSAAHCAAVRFVRVIRHYCFKGCNWMWC